MIADLRHAFRSLLRARAFSCIAIVIIALCLGTNLTIFAVIDSVLLRPLPFPDADRLVTIFNTYPKAGVERDGASLTNYYERRGQIAAFSRLAEFRPGNAVIGETGATERIETAAVTPDFFDTLGLTPTLGRGFEENETTHQTDDVVILTDAYWRKHFNADPDVLTRSLRIDGTARRIVGVLPPSFRFLSSHARIYVPLSSDASRRGPQQRHSGNSITMVARLAPGVSVAQAQSEVEAHNASVAHTYPQAKMIADAGFRSVVAPLHADHVQAIRPVLLFLQAGVLLLLVIGCVNLMNLLLIRASNQAKDFAIRQSMGATWQHVVRHVLAENMLLVALGGIGGFVIAGFGIDLVRVLGADQLPLGTEIAFDHRIAVGAVLGVIALGLVFTLPVAAFNLRSHLANALQTSSRSSTANGASRRLQHSFIITQLALAFVLLTSAALLSVSLERAQAVSPGFKSDSLIAGALSLPWQSYHGDAYIPFTERLTAEVSREPGITSVGLSTLLPLSGNSGIRAITVQGFVPASGESVRGHYGYGVTGEYFTAMGIRLQQGRFIGSDDSTRAVRTCVVDDAFMRRYWPDGDALGRRLFLGSKEGQESESFVVVGVVDTIKQTELTEAEALGTVYLPLAYVSDLRLFLVVSARVAPSSLGATLQALVRRLDPDLPLTDLKTMENRIADTLIARRSPALLASIFAGIALLLAAVGTYGLLSYAVAQRQREIGVRMALGAQATQIGRQFLSIGFRLVGAGVLLGIIGAWLAGCAMQTVLFDVPALHFATLLASVATIGIVALCACYIPARRAARVDPMIALRAE